MQRQGRAGQQARLGESRMAGHGEASGNGGRSYGQHPSGQTTATPDHRDAKSGQRRGGAERGAGGNRPGLGSDQRTERQTGQIQAGDAETERQRNEGRCSQPRGEPMHSRLKGHWRSDRRNEQRGAQGAEHGHIDQPAAGCGQLGDHLAARRRARVARGRRVDTESQRGADRVGVQRRHPVAQKVATRSQRLRRSNEDDVTIGRDGDIIDLPPILAQQAHGHQGHGLVETELDLPRRLDQAGTVRRAQLDEDGMGQDGHGHAGKGQRPGDQHARRMAGDRMGMGWRPQSLPECLSSPARRRW